MLHLITLVFWEQYLWFLQPEATCELVGEPGQARMERNFVWHACCSARLVGPAARVLQGQRGLASRLGRLGVASGAGWGSVHAVGTGDAARCCPDSPRGKLTSLISGWT